MLESHKQIDALLEQRGEDLCYLYDRWQDEQEYEDFAEYREAAQRIIPIPSRSLRSPPSRSTFPRTKRTTRSASPTAKSISGGA